MTIINVDMSETDNKFKELGYNKLFYKDALIYEKKEPHPQQIIFYYDNETVWCEQFIDERWRAMEIDKKIVRLILKKIIELNW